MKKEFQYQELYDEEILKGWYLDIDDTDPNLEIAENDIIKYLKIANEVKSFLVCKIKFCIMNIDKAKR